MRQRVIGAALVLATAAGLTLVVDTSAQAATVEATVGGVTYRADDATPAGGATVVDVTDAAPRALVLPAAVTIGGTSYAVRAVGEGAADGIGLTSVGLPGSLTTIGATAFGFNALTSLALPDSVTTIGTTAFAGNQLTSVDLPDALSVIDESVFAGNALTSVQLPDSLTRIASAAFAFNALTAVTIPASVTGIAAGAFSYNVDLASVVFAGPPPLEFSPTGDPDKVGSLGDESDPMVSFPARFAAPGYTGGFTTPTWRGYDSTTGLDIAPAALAAATVGAASLAAATTGAAYVQDLAGQGGTAPYTFSAKAGSLPPGITLTAAGRLRGTPTLAGTFVLTVTVTDADGAVGARSYSLVVSAPATPGVPPGPPGTPPGVPPGTPPVVTTPPGTAKPRPQLAITKVRRSRQGDVVTYRITARNRGPGKARETRVRFANAPAGVVFPRRTVRIGTLTAGSSAVVVLRVRAADKTTTLWARVRARNADRDTRRVTLPAR